MDVVLIFQSIGLKLHHVVLNIMQHTKVQFCKSIKEGRKKYIAIKKYLFTDKDLIKGRILLLK